MKAYLDLMKDVVDNGMDRGDRTGVGTRSVFGRQIRFDLQDGFPLRRNLDHVDPARCRGAPPRCSCIPP